MAVLPPRSAEEEDAFVASFRDGPAHSSAEVDSTDALIDAVTAAMNDRRPMLAARLVQLLDEQVEIPEGTALHRAARAARMLIFEGADAKPKNWSALEEAWAAARNDHYRRVKKRMRRAVEGKGLTYGRRYGRKS